MEKVTVLTESKIKKLLRTTDFKINKQLLLEEGTIITPSAKEYLNGISVTYREVPINQQLKSLNISDTADNLSQPLPSNLDNVGEFDINYYQVVWENHIYSIISEIVYIQKTCNDENNVEVIKRLNDLITILLEFKDFHFKKANNLLLKVSEDKTTKEISISGSTSSMDTIIPSYTDSKASVLLFRLYTQLNALHIYTADNFRRYFSMEDYKFMSGICFRLAEAALLISRQEVSNNDKRGNL